ncbi:hypothetical protein, partial [Streptomyces sp. NPDC060198]|uniref:hypothetical protein n=1 Tax=Streptomyces sp. NPDC060198 TaxID=3347070 RepID=UPI0036687F2C
VSRAGCPWCPGGRRGGIVDDVQREFGLPAPTVRATKLGRRLYVDVVFVVPHGDWDVGVPGGSGVWGTPPW